MSRRFQIIAGLELAAAWAVVSFVALARAFHFELALASAVIVFAALVADGFLEPELPAGQRTLRLLLVAVIPLVPAQIEQWVRQPCDQGSGFLFYFLYTVPAAVCGAGAALAARRLTQKTWLRLLFVAGVVALPSVWILFTLYADAPVRFHHWIFGMWPGSLYDERVEVTPALYWGRLEGVLYGLLLLLAGSSKGTGIYRHRVATACLAFVALVLLEPVTGVRVTRAGLRRRLQPVVKLESARLYFDPSVPPDVRDKVSATVGDALAAILAKLGLDRTQPVELFVFGDTEARYRATGARFTTFTKPWQGAAYLEPDALVSERGRSLLQHELTHLVTAQWGPVLGLPWNISLLEGTAVAVAQQPAPVPSPDTPSASPSAASSAGYRLAGLSRVVLDKKPDLDLERFLRRLGFWAESPASAYPLAGAFGEFVLETHGPGVLKNLWQLGPSDEPAGSSWKTLATEFRAYLETIEPTDDEKAAGTRIARQKSIFEKRCPHDVQVEEGS